jgi:hypothetical protein
MGKRSGKKQGTMLGHCWPMLTKPASAAGKYADVVGNFWDKCPAADKAKIFKCLVVEFRAIHDFGGGNKGPGMLLKEMGEGGEGSLEPGVASGAEFVMSYPTPFLQYFWSANRDELEPAVRSQLFPDETTTTTANAEEGDAADAIATETASTATVKTEAVKLPLHDYLDPVSSTLNTAGVRRGSYTNKYCCMCDQGTLRGAQGDAGQVQCFQP